MCYILIATYTIWLATVTWFWANRCVKPLNRKTIVAKFFTHVSAHLINGFIKYYSREFLCLMHSTCTRNLPTYRVSSDPSFPAHDTESDLHWGWLCLACKTISQSTPSAMKIWSCCNHWVVTMAECSRDQSKLSLPWIHPLPWSSK